VVLHHGYWNIDTIIYKASWHLDECNVKAVDISTVSHILITHFLTKISQLPPICCQLCEHFSETNFPKRTTVFSNKVGQYIFVYKAP
jgi:hypothetical protein